MRPQMRPRMRRRIRHPMRRRMRRQKRRPMRGPMRRPIRHPMRRRMRRRIRHPMRHPMRRRMGRRIRHPRHRRKPRPTPRPVPRAAPRPCSPSPHSSFPAPSVPLVRYGSPRWPATALPPTINDRRSRAGFSPCPASISDRPRFSWREYVGIEPTQRRITTPQAVLKTVPATRTRSTPVMSPHRDDSFYRIPRPTLFAQAVISQ